MKKLSYKKIAFFVNFMSNKKSIIFVLSILLVAFVIYVIYRQLAPSKHGDILLNKKDIIARMKDYYNVKTDMQDTIDADYGELEKQLLKESISNFILNPNITRRDKIRALWNIAKELHGPEYLNALDMLELLSPIELTGELTKAFSETEDTLVKKRLLNIMRTSLDIANPESQNQEQLSYIATQTESISNFIEDQIKNDNQPEMNKDLLHAYSVVAPAEDIANMLIDIKENRSDMLSPTELVDLWAVSAFATPDSQKLLVPGLIENISTLSHNEQHAEYKILFQIIDQTSVTPEMRQTVSDYLLSIEPKNSSNDPLDREWLENRYNWLLAYASATTTNINEKNQFIISKLVNSTDPYYQANILIYAQPDVLSLLNTNERAKITASINQALISLSDRHDPLFERDLLESAIDKLIY